MVDLSIISDEIFEIIKSFGYSQTLYDSSGNRTDSPFKARRIFVKKENILISIADDYNYSSVTLYIGQNNKINGFLSLIDTLRTNCSKYNILFNVSTYDGEIKPKGLLVSETIKRDIFMRLFEGMYGTSDVSCLKLENAKMIVKHSKKTTDMRERAKCIESIIVEDSNGNTFPFVPQQILAAKAMTQHLNHNGEFADAIGQQICRMANDFRNLGMAVNYTSVISNDCEPIAYAVVQEACKKQFKKLKENFDNLFTNYNATAKTFSRICEDKDDKDDDTQIEEMRDLLMTHETKCSSKIAEAACKAMKKEKKSLREYLSLKENHEQTISVLGKPIDKTVWEDFKHGVMATTSKFKNTFFDNSPTFKNKTAEFVYKLTRLIPKIEDHALSNILSSVVDSVEDERNSERKKKLIAVGMKALKNAGVELDDGLQSTVIKEYNSWLSSFTHMNEGYDEVKVFGKSVPKTIWDRFKKGFIELSGKPDLDVVPKFANKKAELLFTLHKLLPYIKDDSLHNLLAEVLDDVDTVKDRNKKNQYLGLLNHAAESIGLKLVHESASLNRDYIDFDPESHDWCVYDGDTDEVIARFESEEGAADYLDRMNSKITEDAKMYGLLDEDGALDDEFNIDDFWKSKSRLEIIGSGKNENISRHDLFLAIKSYFTKMTKNASDKETVDHIDALADAYLQQVVNYAVMHGYQVVNDKNNLEKVREDSDILDAEDVLLPPDDEYVSFRDEVIAKTARDPITGKEVDTDGDYLDRLKTLAGMKQTAEFDNGY